VLVVPQLVGPSPDIPNEKDVFGWPPFLSRIRLANVFSFSSSFRFLRLSMMYDLWLNLLKGLIVAKEKDGNIWRKSSHP